MVNLIPNFNSSVSNTIIFLNKNLKLNSLTIHNFSIYFSSQTDRALEMYVYSLRNETHSGNIAELEIGLYWMIQSLLPFKL